MNWRARRQMAYLSILLGIIILILLILILPRITRTPTCFDGKQNGLETGVDCGGECVRACPTEVREIAVLWSRAFPVTQGVWNAMAYLENRNVGLTVKSMRYRFRFYDKDNVFISERTGQTFLPPNSRSFIFQSSMDMGLRFPYRTVLEISSPSLEWLRLDSKRQDVINQITASDKVLDDSSGLPQLSARINNSSVYDIQNVEVAALIYGSENIVLAASRTILDSLPANGSEPVFFSWPQPLSQQSVQIEILTKIDALSLNL